MVFTVKFFGGITQLLEKFLQYSLAMKSATELDVLISSKPFFGLILSLSKQNVLFCAKINEI